MGKQHTPQHLNRKVKIKKSAGVAIAVPAVCLVLLMILIGAVIGRYQRQFNSEGSIRAKEFYFTSDFLNGSTHTLAPGSTEVGFTLGNHIDELRYSEVDIAYEVTVTLDDGTPADGVTVEYGNNGKKLIPGNKQDDEVTIKNLDPGTYTVTAVGTGGYEKTLTAKIKVLPVESVVYKHLDTTNSDYVLLTVWAQGYKGNVAITPPAGLIPDNTDPVMGSVTTGGTPFTDTSSFRTDDNADGYASHTYRFFGSGATAEDFKVTYDGKDATEKEPS